jgi:hypothetical protein
MKRKNEEEDKNNETQKKMKNNGIIEVLTEQPMERDSTNTGNINEISEDRRNFLETYAEVANLVFDKQRFGYFEKYEIEIPDYIEKNEDDDGMTDIEFSYVSEEAEKIEKYFKNKKKYGHFYDTLELIDAEKYAKLLKIASFIDKLVKLYK